MVAVAGEDQEKQVDKNINEDEFFMRDHSQEDLQMREDNQLEEVKEE